MQSNLLVDKLSLLLPSPVQPLKHKLFIEHNVQVLVKRDDLIHPIISGNKFRKLRLNLLQALHDGHDTILTFGGAYSNHLDATSFACKLLNLKLIAVIRGEEPKELSPTLKRLLENGSTLHFVSRADYDLKENEHFLADLRNKFGVVFIIPEGGANYKGIMGCADIISELDSPDYTDIFLAAGTGTTSAGVLTEACKIKAKVTAVQVLKGEKYLYNEIKNKLYYTYWDQDLVDDLMENLSVLEDFHFGGYAKKTTELLTFMQSFESETGLKTDYVYTAKMFFALCKRVENGTVKPGSKILAIHTGGLQGNVLG